MKFQDQIERELSIPVPIDQVWQAISTPEGLSKWFSNHVSFTQEVGSALEFTWKNHGTTDGYIEQIDPPYTFAYRWRAHNAIKTEPITTENSTLVTFTLKAVENGTHLTVLETGFTGLSTETRESNYSENVTGWRVELQELVEYLTGVTA